jgi:hypothetical protein
MSKEIYQAYDGTTALYAFVQRPSDGYIWDPSLGTPAFVVWNAANVTNYDIPLVASGKMYYADFPVLITTAGVYQVFVCARAGVNPAVSDMNISQGFMEWSGSQEITNLSVVSFGNTDLTPITQSIQQLQQTGRIVQNVIDETKQLEKVITTESL